MVFGLIIIGDEIIIGKRQDKHLAQGIKILSDRGLKLSWCEYIGDDRQRIIDTLKRTFSTDDIVFSFGGIGATPDDHTRQAAASAANVPLARHSQAVAEIEARFGKEAYPKRVLMADFPQDSKIIPNPYNRVPGFSVGQHYFLPGFPEMAWPMMEWVLDQYYVNKQTVAREIEQSIIVYASESQLLDLMNENVNLFSTLKLFSLPSLGNNSADRYLELGVRGDASLVPVAMQHLQDGVSRLGYRWSLLT